MAIRHCCCDIEGLLRHSSKKDSLAGVLTDTETGYPLSDAAARAYLNACLAKGWRVLPMGNCDNFDYQTGCKGHQKKDIETK